MTKCILHIGKPKTGTTSIQWTLFQARAILKRRFNVEYWDGIANHSFVIRRFFDKGRLKHSIKRPQSVLVKALTTDFQQVSDSFDAAIGATTADTFIICAEALSTLNQPEVEAFKATLEPHFSEFEVYVYVREPISWLHSMAAQKLTRGFTLEDVIQATQDPDSTMLTASCRTFYEDSITPFQNVFGADRVTICDFTRDKLIHGDVVDDFTQRALNIDLDKQKIKKRFLNEGLGLAAASLLSAVNGRGAQTAELTRWLLKQSYQTKFRLTGFDLNAYAGQVAGDVAWLKDATDGRIDFTRSGDLNQQAVNVSEEMGTLMSANAQLVEILGEDFVRKAV